MPAHMFSVMADMPRLTEIAASRGVRLVEDSAVAQGAVLAGTPAGLWGEAGVYSFVQVKSVSAAVPSRPAAPRTPVAVAPPPPPAVTSPLPDVQSE